VTTHKKRKGIHGEVEWKVTLQKDL
jgi:hypothetical protein